MLSAIKETSDYLKNNYQLEVDTAIILGTGLGGLVKEIEIEASIPYEEIPNFPVSTVEGHAGRLIKGKIAGKPILAMQGRFHYYEGYNMSEVTFPVRVFKFLGVKNLIVSNASGGMNPDFVVGDVMIITDHINHFPEHPLRGKNMDVFGPRFPDMSEVYCKKYVDLAGAVAAEKKIDVKYGVYVGTQGPTFETPAEYGMFRILGGDAVGMSTVPEVIVAHHAGIKCFAISIITDMGIPETIEEVSHEEVQKVAIAAEPKLTAIVKGVVAGIGRK